MKPILQHQREIHQNARSWEKKPLLRTIYASFYERILSWVDPSIPGKIVEIGSGIGNLKAHCPGAICTDLFPNPWLDLVCDGYDLPFADGSVSHLVLFDVFHHLEAPAAFLRLAKRKTSDRGRIILFEPFISVLSRIVYGVMHHEPVAMRQPINESEEAPQARQYYAAQGNATRLFFGTGSCHRFGEWTLLHAEAFSCLNYFLSGGYSKPSLCSMAGLPFVTGVDRLLSRWPSLFGGRCLVVLEASHRA